MMDSLFESRFQLFRFCRFSRNAVSSTFSFLRISLLSVAFALLVIFALFAIFAFFAVFALFAFFAALALRPLYVTSARCTNSVHFVNFMLFSLVSWLLLFLWSLLVTRIMLFHDVSPEGIVLCALGANSAFCGDIFLNQSPSMISAFYHSFLLFCCSFCSSFPFLLLMWFYCFRLIFSCISLFLSQFPRVILLFLIIKNILCFFFHLTYFLVVLFFLWHLFFGANNSSFLFFLQIKYTICFEFAGKENVEIFYFDEEKCGSS